MLSISQSERFKSDVSRYQAAIDQIENLQKKTKMLTLLDELIREVAAIDKVYENLNFKLERPATPDRSKILSIRKELERGLGN
jgi:hypothetical protein